MKKRNQSLIEKKRAEFAACKTREEMEAVMHKYRSHDMLTVKDLIAFLKKCNPNACVLAYEPNSSAYIEQFKKLPNMSICTIEDDKKRELEHLNQWYKGSKDKDKKIKEAMDEMYRYSEDDDVVIKF